jgi:uncharacterized membrane protein
MEISKKNWLKFGIGFIFCLLIRLIPFRPPNIEPILATQMPFSKAYGAYVGFLFSFFSIVFYDLVTNTLGVWTLITASTYGVLGFASYFYFQKFKANMFGYASFAVIGTLLFDVITGLSVGPLFFHQSFQGALWGQIPFTLWHLLGNVSFALILSPAIYNFVIDNKKLDNIYFTKIFNPI